MKDESTYLVITSQRGLKLISNNTEIYSCKLSRFERGKSNGGVYVKHLDCFLFTKANEVWRKDINDLDPCILMDHSSPPNFAYSSKNQRLISFNARKAKSRIVVINIDKKG